VFKSISQQKPKIWQLLETSLVRNRWLPGTATDLDSRGFEILVEDCFLPFTQMGVTESFALGLSPEDKEDAIATQGGELQEETPSVGVEAAT
jgi:hypothetical protein